MPFKLVGIEGPGEGLAFVIQQAGYLLIGRAPDVTFRLPDEDRAASRHHALLEMHDDGVVVHDLADQGTTFINGKRAGTGLVRVGDRLQLGTTVFSVSPVALDAGANQRPRTLGMNEDELRGGTFDRAATSFTVIPPAAREAFDELSDEGSVDDFPAVKPPTLPISPDAADALTCDECGAAGIAPPDADLRDASWLCVVCIHRLRKLGPYDPSTLGSFQMLRQLAAGGMAMVYDAVSVGTGIRAAVKVVFLDPPPPERVLLRFVREQRITRALRHPNIVRCYEVGSHWGRPYIASEFVGGGNALDLASSTSSPDEVLWIGADLFRALAFAHHRGIVHRDVKPANLLLTRPERTGVRRGRLADFGLAKSLHHAQTKPITERGEAGGSVLMLSPEQLMNFMGVGPSGDLYSGGATLFRMLTASTPLRLKSHMNEAPLVEIGAAINHSSRVPIRDLRPDLPTDLCQLIDSLVATDPSVREKLDAARIAAELDRHAAAISTH